MKNELGGKVMVKFIRLRAKADSYLTNDGNENKKAKCTKKSVPQKENLNLKIIKIV